VNQTVPVFTQVFDTGTSSVTYELPPLDLSMARAVIVHITLTKADTGAGDILDVKFQDRVDELTWNTRARMPLFLGTLSPSSTAPETYQQTIVGKHQLTTGEESHEPTGSAGATELAVDSVAHGPLKKFLRTSSGRKTAHRVVLVVTNGTAADFEGTIRVYAVNGA
jgi:hypothetical protein